MKMLFLLSLLLVFTGCSKSSYEIIEPINGKFHPIIRIQNDSVNLGGIDIPGGSCTAFVINDEIAVTAGHCMKITQSTLDTELAAVLPLAIKELESLKAELAMLRSTCAIGCEFREQQLLQSIQFGEHSLKIATLAKADKFKVFTLDGSDTKIQAIAHFKGKRRDFGFIKGDFKKFNKMYIAPGFPVKKGDMFKACGYAGSYSPPVCIDFEAVQKHVFDYAGYSMFVPGMSGGPIVDADGAVIGIVSTSPGKFAVMVPMLGVIQLIKAR